MKSLWLETCCVGLVLHFKHLIPQTSFFLSFKMSSVLSGFADADAWMYRADGEIVGRARNDTYAEKVRAGLPAYVLVADPTPAPPVESCVVAPDVAAEPLKAPCVTRAGHDTVHCTDVCCTDWWMEAGSGYDAEHGKYADWDFDRYFAPVESRATARARRTGGARSAAAKRPAKQPKYGPKPTKKRTAADSPAAAALLPKAAEAVPNCAILKTGISDARCACCGLVQDVAEYCFCIVEMVHACHHCRDDFAMALEKAHAAAAAYNAYLKELANEIRMEERIRDARYYRD